MPCGYGSRVLIHHGSVAFAQREAQAVNQSQPIGRMRAQPSHSPNRVVRVPSTHSWIRRRGHTRVRRRAALTARGGRRHRAQAGPAVRRGPQDHAEGIQSACVRIRTSTTRPVQLLAPFASTTTPASSGRPTCPPSVPMTRFRSGLFQRPTRVEPGACWRFKEEAVARRDFSKFEQDSPASLSVSWCDAALSRTGSAGALPINFRQHGQELSQLYREAKQLQTRRGSREDGGPSLSLRGGVPR